MLNDITLFSAFLTGLMGSVHCIGMCGGIVTALSMGVMQQQSFMQRLPYLLAYNIGRISSYIIAGAILGFIGAQITQLSSTPVLIHLWVSGIFMLLLGFYISGWWKLLIILEKAGALFWQKISPLGKKLLPIKTPLQALAVGVLWGWLPCGLVYTALAFALVSGGTWQGAAIMFAFAIGTLPMLLAMGTTAHWLVQFSRHRLVRHIIGLLLMGFGIYTLLSSSEHVCHAFYGSDMCYN